MTVTLHSFSHSYLLWQNVHALAGLLQHSLRTSQRNCIDNNVKYLCCCRLVAALASRSPGAVAAHLEPLLLSLIPLLSNKKLVEEASVLLSALLA